MQVSLLSNRLVTVPGGPLSSIDTRAKIILSIVASLATIVLSHPIAQLVLFCASFIYALSMRKIKLIAVAYLFCCAIMGIALIFAKLMAAIFPLPPVGLGGLAVPFIRLGVMINVILPLAFTTSVQSVLTALRHMHLPFVLYIPMAVMVRYIPTFLNDCRYIFEALKIRGYTLSFRQFIRHPVLSMRFILIPLVFRSLKTSEDLGIAAELKGLGLRRVPTPYKALIWRHGDTLLVCAGLAVAILAFGCDVFLQREGSLLAVEGVMR